MVAQEWVVASNRETSDRSSLGSNFRALLRTRAGCLVIVMNYTGDRLNFGAVSCLGWGHGGRCCSAACCCARVSLACRRSRRPGPPGPVAVCRPASEPRQRGSRSKWWCRQVWQAPRRQPASLHAVAHCMCVSRPSLTHGHPSLALQTTARCRATASWGGAASRAASSSTRLLALLRRRAAALRM